MGFRDSIQRTGLDSRITSGQGSARPAQGPTGGGSQGGNGNGKGNNGQGGGNSGPGDPQFSQVVALLHFEGTPGTATFTNSAVAGNTFQDNGGSTKINNNRSKFGSCSLDCTALTGIAGLGGLSNYTIAALDYTIEMWVQILSQALDFNSVKVYYDSRNSSLTNGNFPSIYSDTADGQLKVSFNGVVVITTATNVMTAGGFRHMALCRVNGNTKLFVEGIQVGSTWVDANTYAQPNVSIMSAGNNAGNVLGSCDEFRYTKGTINSGAGRYPSNFTPPSQSFSDK